MKPTARDRVLKDFPEALSLKIGKEWFIYLSPHEEMIACDCRETWAWAKTLLRMGPITRMRAKAGK